MTWTNLYRHCGREWRLEDCDSTHNDHCPECDAEIEPYDSREEPTASEVSA